MKKPQKVVPLQFTGAQLHTAKAIAIPEQLDDVLKAASAKGNISHAEARELLAKVKDVVLEETGLTRQQLDYELYLRTMSGD
jgi:hypothetical protein